MNTDKLTQFLDPDKNRGFVKSDIQSIFSTRSWEEMDNTREQALTDYMAGVTEQLTPAQTQPDLSTLNIDHSKLKGNPYDTQAEVLSRLSLLDENLNPTQTYTDYINAGGTPVPGYESSHNQLLKLDLIQEKQQELDEGKITEDQMLWDLYATDILETQGYKVRSVGWWQSKYQNNDFTNPLTNQYLQQQVLQTAREYHNSLQAQKYTKQKQASDSRLSVLLNKGDLSNEDIESLFPELTKAISDTQDDTNYMSYITSGRVSAQQRIYQAADGTYYYLHTDGELYKLSNEEHGSKIASYKQDENGSFIEISLNGSDAIDLLNSFKSGASSIVTGFAKLGGFLWGATIGAIQEGDFIEGISNTMSAMDSFFNDDLAWMTDSRYVDMDGFQMGNIKDWGMFISSTLGAMTAGAITGAAAGKVVGWGASLQASGHPVAGKIVSWGASLYQRSTGLYKGAGTGFYNEGIITKHIATSWLPTFNNFKTVGVYMTKDFMNTTSQLYSQKIQMQLADYQNDPESYDPTKYGTNSDIFWAASKVTAINGLISSVLAGGMDDNQTQRWAALLGGAGKDISHPEMLNKFGNAVLKYSIALNTTADFLDNFLTNWTTSQVKIDKDGKVDGFNIFNKDDWNILSAEGARTLTQAAIMTLPTFQKQLQRRNVAAEQATAIHKNYLDRLVEEEQKTSDSHQKEILQTIRLNYLEDMQKGMVDDKGNPIANQSQADKILYALSKQHEYLANSQNDSIVTDVLKKTCDPIMLGIYTNVNKLAEESYESYLANVKDMDKNLETKGVRAFLSNLISEHFRKNYTQRAAALQYDKAKMLNGAIAPNGRDIIDNFTKRAVDTYLTITDSKDSTDMQEHLVSKLGLTSDVLEKSKESYLTQRQLKNRNKDINDSTLLDAAQKKADQLNNGNTGKDALSAEQVLGASKFFRVKNESEDRPTFNAERAALFVASQVLPDNFYKIDDYTYGMLALDSEISKMFTSDLYSKMSVGMNALGSNDPNLKAAGIELMLTSMWGDTATKYFRKGQYDKAVAKDNVEMLLNAAIENKVITKRDAAEFLMSLSDSDNATGKELDKVFKSNVSVTNLNKLSNLSDLEKYTLLYGSVLQLSNKDTNRFSGKTIAAESMMQQGYDKILFDVLKDLEGNYPDWLKQFAIKADAAREKNELFPLATDSCIRGLTKVIGDDTIKTESDLKKYLHSLAKDATAEEVNAQANVLFDMIKDLRRYKSIDYKGDTVSIDISEWSNESYRKMIKAINSTSPEYLDSMLQRKSLPLVTDPEANQVMAIRSADKKPLLTISLDDSNMEQITALYDMLKAGNIIPTWTRKPETADDMKRILANQVDMNETKFLRYKDSKQYNTGIISDKDAELIRTRLKQYEPKDIIKAATVFDETIDKEVKAMRYDYFTMLGSNISINKLSEAANSKAFRIEGSPYYINPVNPSTLKQEKNGAPIFVTYNTSNENKMGRAASTVSSILGLKNISSYDIAEVNKDLALTLMTDQYIDFLMDNKNKLNIMVPAKYANKLHDLEIAGTDSSFYDLGTIPIEVDGKNYFSLTLKDNVTKEAMEVYLLSSKTPNLFKILPFVSSDNADFKNIKFLSPEGNNLEFIPDIRAGNLSDPNGLYQMLNIMFDYDQTGKLRQDLLSGMFEQAKNGKFNYNPFSDLKQEFNIDELCKRMNNNDIVEAYTEYRKGNLQKDLDDPFYTLAVAYRDINSKYTDDKNNDDYKLWLLHGNVLKRMIKAAQDGDASVSIPEIKKLYAESTNFNPVVGYYSIDQIPYRDISTGSFYNSPINITGDTVMSKHLLDTATGVDYHLVDEHGNYTLPKILGDQSIIDAFNYVKNNINAFDQTQDIMLSAWSTNNKNFRYYEPSDATHLWTILSAAEGSITIEDLDALTRIEADAYNRFFEELGMKQGYGLEVKNKVDTLYNKLSKYFLTPEQQGTLINKTLTFKEPRTGSASTSEQYNRMFANINSKAAKQAFNNRALEYVQSFEDRPQVTPERLVDGLSTAYDDFDASYKNYKRSDLDTYKAKLYNQKGEIAVNDNGDFHGNQFIDDISSEINIEKLARSAENTHNSIAEKLDINIQNKDIDNNLIDYATTVTERLTGSKFLGEYAKWSFLDTETGREYANAVITNNDNMYSNVDLVKTLWDENKTNSDWIGKAFIDFEKKDTSGEGLNYRYKILNNENDVINLKNDVLLDLIKTNEWKLDGDVDSFINKMSTQEGANFINKIITNGITNRDKLTLLDNIFKDTNISNTWQYKVLAPTYLTDINKNTIRDIEGQLSSALNSTNPMVRRIGNAILFGIDYDGMDNEHKLSADFIKSLLSTGNIDYIQKNKTELDDLEYKINSGEQLTDYNLNKYRDLYDITENRESVTNALYKYVIRNFDNPEVLDYFFNSKRTLNERYDLYTNGYNDSYKLKDVANNISSVSIKDIRDFFDDNNLSYNGDLKKIIAFDTEGSNILKASGQTADSIKDLFQIAFITYTRDENGKLVANKETYFIDHGGNDSDRFSKWVEAQIDDKDTNFYAKHKDYQEATKAYAKLTGIEDNIITEDQVADILNGRLTSTPDLLVAYNGDNYEFRVLKGLLNKDIKTLDALEVVSKTEGDASKQLSQDSVYKRTFGDDHGDERHTADQDVSDMMELLNEYFNADNDLAYDRSLLVRNLLTLIPEEYQDAESIKSIFDIVENKLHDGGDLQETFNKVLGTFKQYEPTLDNIKAMQRAYNNLYNEAKGNVFFKIREALGYNPDNGRDLMVGSSKARNNIKNILAAKMVETNGDPIKAYNALYYDYINNSDEADKSENKFFKYLGTLDENTLNKIHIDPEVFNTEEVNNNKKTLDFFKDGEAGYLKGNIPGVTSEVAKDFDTNKKFLSYVYSTEDTLIKNKDLISEDTFNIFKDWFANRAISINENYDIKNLPEYINKAVEYKTAGVDSLLAEIKNIISSNRGTGTFHGMYSMMDAVKPGLNEDLFEVVNLGTKGEKLVQLDNVEAGDIVVTRRYLEDILNVHNITDLRSDDPNDKNLYLLSITNPADNMNSILPLRVRVIDSDDLTVRFTPETQAILRNRDFDGDHTITTTLAPGMKPVVKLIHDYMFNTYNVYEDMSKFLKGLDTNNMAADDFSKAHIYKIGSNGKVIKVCKEIDTYLDKIKSITDISGEKYQKKIANLNAKLLDAIETSDEYKDITASRWLLPNEKKDFASDLLKQLGIKETFTNTDQVLRYVNNPALFSDADTYTNKSRRAMFARQTLTGSNILDPKIGWAQKGWASEDAPSKTITNPLLDIYTPGIYMTGGVERMIDNSINTKERFDQYIDTLKSSIAKQVTEDKFDTSASYLKDINTELDNLKQLTTDNFADKAKQATMQMLWDLDIYTKSDTNVNKQFLTKLNDVAKDDSFKQQLNIAKLLDNKLNELSKSGYSLYSNHVKDTPLADMLQQEAVANRLGTSESGQLRLKDSISDKYNLVNIFITKGATKSEDSIAYTESVKDSATAIAVLPKGKGIEYNKLPVNTLIKQGTVIGHKGNKPIEAPYNFYVNPQKKFKDDIIINIPDNIQGKKLSGQGLFKGVAGTQITLDNDPNNIAFVVDVKNATKNANKYSMGFDYMKAWKEAEPYTYTINGKEYSGYILKNVPTNIIGDDDLYTQKINPNDPNTVKRFEVMSVPGTSGLLGIGMYGSSGLKYDEEGNLKLDTSDITEALKENRPKHNAVWGDTGTLIMQLRSEMLAQALGEKAFLGLANKYSPNEFTSLDEYLTNLKNSREKINSQATLNEQNAMIRSLGKQRFINLYNKSDLTRYIFGREVQRLISPEEPNTFSEEFYTNPESPSSKASGKDQLRGNAKVIPGRYETPEGRNIENRGLIQNTLLHVPFDQFYHGVTGKYLNQNEMIQAIIDGRLGYSRFFDNSAMIENDFTPVDTSMGSREYNFMNKNVANAGEKTIVEGLSDYFRPADYNYGTFRKGSNSGNVFEGANDPYKPTFNSLVSKAVEEGHILSGYTPWQRFAYYMSVGEDRTKNTLSKIGTIKGYDSVDMHKYTPQFINKKYGDNSTLNFIRVGEDKNVDLNNIQSEVNRYTKGYMLRKDISENIDKPEFTAKDISDFKKSGTYEAYKNMSAEAREARKEKAIAYKNLVAALNSQSSNIVNNNIKFTWDVENSTTPWKDSVWSRSGIKVDDEKKLAVDIGIKNRFAESQYIQEEYLKQLTDLRVLVSKTDSNEFENFAKYKWLEASKQVDPEGYETRAKYMGVSDSLNTLEANYKNYVAKHPDVVKAYDTYVDNIINLAKQTSELRNEPFDSSYIFFAPYVPSNKETRYNTIISNIRTMMSINKYDPISKRNAVQQNMMFNFFEGSERIIKDLSEAYAVDNISKALLGEYTGKALIDNKRIINAAFDLIDNPDVFKDLKIYNKFDSDITNEVLNVLSLYTDIDTYNLRKSATNGGELLRQAYNKVNADVDYLKEEFTELTGLYPSLDQVYKIAHSNEYNESTKQIAKQTADYMWSEIIIGQRLIECSPSAQHQFESFISDINQEGYVLVNKYGQKIERNKFLNPTTSTDLAYLKDNIEIAANSKNDSMWTQFLLEKALSGEIYLAKADMVDQLEKTAYTTKIPNRIVSTLKKISSQSAGFQMALPAKMLGRLIRFTGFDYAMGAIGNYNTLPNISRAAKELSAALQSDGKAMTEDLRDYLMREGQPSYGKGVAAKDPINFTEDMGKGLLSKITNKLSSPLEFQNHLGRYAIYLTAKESFDNNNPWYGSQYYNHEAIDAIKDNRDKAMYVMDYMLGSPGGFPALSKKTAGYMMYSTFPMNLTRTMGAYGMSVAKLFQEGVTENNVDQWYNTVIMPSLGTIGISMLGNLIISAICDRYGIDEETEKKWKEEGVSLDPLGTLLGGTPSVVYDSMNPIYNLKEMFINPFTNEYNDTLPKKGYGWIKANMLSKLNPALKMPIEIVTGKDLYGDNAEGYQTADPLFNQTKKNQYTTLENGMKKVLGYFVGSGVANSIVDERKIAARESGDDTPSLNSYLWKGITRGVSYDLGNQKSWKKNTSNYYSFLTDMKTWRKANAATSQEGTGNATNANGYYYLDIEDMTDAEKLYYNRTYGSMYGTFDDDDYKRVSSTLKKYINEHRDASTIYAYIVQEYNDNKVSEATMRAALNNNSILRKINQLKTGNLYIEYLKSLTATEKARLQDAIEYEQEYYPILQYLFPDNVSKKKAYLPSYKKDYIGSGSGSSPRSPYVPSNRYYPGRYYPSTYRFNKKTGKYGPNLKRVQVNVSPQMAIWNQDKNLTQYQTGLDKTNDPQWLRSRDYTSRVYNI